MKKRKRFYNNKKRNQKWTEEETGRKIAFADKYIEGGSSSDKFDSKRPKRFEDTARKKARRQKRLKALAIILICIVLISVGYTGMDIYMTSRAGSFNPQGITADNREGMKDIDIRLSSLKTDSISLDSSVMLSAVINDNASLGFTSITFDAKRSDGTIGYASKLASVDTFSAISSPASKPRASVKELLANDLLPVARISCYKDNVAVQYLADAAITTKSGKLYKDSDSNSYLNPNSESAYNYIKDIITELSSMGITVFVLCDTELPEEISSGYADGFNTLSAKLYRDIGTGIKLLEEVDVSINGRDENGKVSSSAIKKEIDEFEKIDKNKTYVIYSKTDIKRLVEQLSKSNITSYIITQE